jgi:hypothetical protein
MTTATPGAAPRIHVPAHGQARHPGGAGPTPCGDPPGLGAHSEDAPVLVFFDGLADPRELAVWGAWRRGRGEV